MDQERREEQLIIGLIYECRDRLASNDSWVREFGGGMKYVLDVLDATEIEPGFKVSIERGPFGGEFAVMRQLIRSCRQEASFDTREGNALKRVIDGAHTGYVFSDAQGPGIEFRRSDTSSSNFTIWRPTPKSEAAS